MRIPTRRGLAPAAVAFAAVLATANIVTAQADAATTAATVAHPASCGGPVTVTTPASGTLTAANEGAYASALDVSAASPLLRRAQATHARWLTTLDCKAEPGHTHLLSSGAEKAAADKAAGDTVDQSEDGAGYVAADSTAYTVWSEWTVPTVTDTPDVTENKYSSIWPGIGADNGSGELLQDGTEQDYLCAQASGSTCAEPEVSYYFWLQMYPAEDEETVGNLNASPGDSVATEVVYTASSAAVEFLMCDYTENSCVEGTQTTPAAPEGTVEWILGSDLPLADFGTATLTDNGVDDATHTNVGPATVGAAVANMYDSSGKELASTGSIDSSDEFTVSWLNAS